MNDEEEKQKHTLWLYKGDYAALAAHYVGIPTALIIRQIIREHLRAIEGAPTKLPKMEDLDL